MAAGEVVNPGAAAAAPPPAAPPSAPVAAPAPVVAPAAAAPASPAPAAGPKPGESGFEFLTRVQNEKIAAAAKEPEKPEAAKAAEPAKPADAPDDALPKVEGADPEKPAEDAKPPEVEAKPDEDGEKLSLEPDEPLATSKLAATLKEHPEVVEALEKAGIDRNSLFATARVAAKGAKVLEMFDGDLEIAQHAKEQAVQFGELSQLFASQAGPEDTQKLLQEFMKFSYELDDEGNVAYLDDGQGNKIPKGDGTVGRFIDNTFQIGLNFWKQKADKLGDADMKAACETLQAEYEKQSGRAPADYSDLDESTKQRLEAADAREKDLATREAADHQRKEQEFEVNVAKSIDGKVDGEIDQILAQAPALTDGQKKWARDQIKERVVGKVKNNPLFFNKLDMIMRRPMSEKTMQTRLAHGINSARPFIPGVTREVLAELGVQFDSRQKAVQQTTAARQQASRSEVKAASQVAAPQAQPTPAELNKIVREEFQAKHGREPKTAEMFQAIFEKKRALGVV